MGNRRVVDADQIGTISRKNGSGSVADLQTVGTVVTDNVDILIVSERPTAVILAVYRYRNDGACVLRSAGNEQQNAGQTQ